MTEDLLIGIGEKTHKTTRDEAMEKVENAYEKFRSSANNEINELDAFSFDSSGDFSSWF